MWRRRKYPGTEDNPALLVTASLLSSIDFYPKYKYTISGKWVPPSSSTHKGFGRVFIGAINDEVEKKAWMLHEGGFSSPMSAFPSYYIPPRPFMTFPDDFYRNYIINKLQEKFRKVLEDFKLLRNF